jgi:hypothetical protein
LAVVHTVFLMTLPHIQMDIAFPSMVCGVGVGELGDPWAWILGKRMEEREVHRVGEKLKTCELNVRTNERSNRSSVPGLPKPAQQCQQGRLAGKGLSNPLFQGICYLPRQMVLGLVGLTRIQARTLVKTMLGREQCFVVLQILSKGAGQVLPACDTSRELR